MLNKRKEPTDRDLSQEYPEKFCVNNLPTKHGLLARHSCPFPLVFAELPEVSLVMRAAGVNDAAGFRES